MKLYQTAFLWVVICFNSLATQIDYDEYKEKYPKASSVVLQHQVSISYFIDQKTSRLKARSKHQLKVLALDDNSPELSLIQIPYSQYENLKLKSAKYFMLDSLGEKVLRENVKVKFAEDKDFYIDGIFYSDLKVKQFAPTLAVIEKSILEYSYEIIYEDLKFLNSFYTKDPAQVVEEYSLSISIPDHIDAEVKAFNVDGLGMNQTDSETNLGTKLTYSLSNLKNESKTNLPSNFYLPHFVVLTKSYQINTNRYSVLRNTNDLYQWYRSLIGELRTDKKAISALAQQIAYETQSPEEEIQSIFKWVQTHINYVAFEDGIAGFKPSDAQEVIQLKYGDCKGIANVMVELLRARGFEASHGWVGTRRLQYDYSLPSLIVDNHMVCALNRDGKTYILDGTDKTSNWNSVPNHLQGKEVMVARGSEYEIISVPITEAEKNDLVISSSSKFLQNKLIVSGAISGKGTHHRRVEEFVRIYNDPTLPGAGLVLSDYFLEDFLPSGNCQIGPEKEVLFDGIIRGGIINSNREIYLYMDFEKSYENEPEENIGVYFESKNRLIFSHEFEMPEGYRLSVLPKSTDYASNDGKFLLSTEYSYADNKVSYKKVITINTLKLSSRESDRWSVFTNMLNKVYREPVILEKL